MHISKVNKVIQKQQRAHGLKKNEIIYIQIMLLIHCFSVNSSYKQIITEASVGNSQLSKITIIDWFSFCIEVCMISMGYKNINKGKTGGPGHSRN